ncbi:MAG: hypothetical protein Q8927_21445 [Bacteroidota bacterium]|nr:hypothetical protein [Bacteroidota bacterium]MDP4247458.1 hypothetical protein [Bacteroidota bacterium]MDP4260493.1 hypothetical protein [Bacteroidota bacterium]
MKTSYFISLNMRTANGFECFGRFDLGCDRQFAYSLFDSLRGTDAVNETDMLHMDLMEVPNGLPVNLRVIGCTSMDIALNGKIITEAMFKLLNLGETMIERE